MTHFNCEGGVIEPSRGGIGLIDWIPIYVNYPEYNKPVLTSDGESIQIRILRLDQQKIKYWSSDHIGNMYQVTHWMELPEPPK